MERLHRIGLGLLLPTVATASPCEVPLSLRSVTPELNQHNVPRDSRVLVSFIGQGSDTEFEVALLEAENAVEAETQSWCYEHEGPFEKHCWFSLKPTEPLRSNQRYTIQIQSTDSYSGETPFFFDSSFHTASDTHPELDSSAPVVKLVELTDFEESEIGECDYEQPRRILIEPSHPLSDEDRLGVYHIEELREDDSAFPVHTVFVTQPVMERDFVIKQYADLMADPTGCYRLWIEDGSGEVTDKAEFCWAEFFDTGLEDTGSPDSDAEDTGLSDTSPLDTAVSEDSGSNDTSPPELEDSQPEACTCSQAPASPTIPLVGFALLIIHGVRRRTTDR